MMMRQLIAAAALITLALPVHPVLAAEQIGWRTNAPAVLYDSPSVKGVRQFILSGHYPLRQISRVDGWRKVATHGGDIGWVAEDRLEPFNAAVVVSDRLAARRNPHVADAAVFYAKRGVTLAAIGDNATAEWILVQHPDGEQGYALASDLWLNH